MMFNAQDVALMMLGRLALALGCIAAAVGLACWAVLS